MGKRNKLKNERSELFKILISFFNQCKLLLLILITILIVTSLINNYVFSKYLGIITESILEENLKNAKKYGIYFILILFLLQFIRLIDRKVFAIFLQKLNSILKEKSMDRFLLLQIEVANENCEKINRFVDRVSEAIQTMFFLIKMLYGILITVGMLWFFDRKLGFVVTFFLFVYFPTLFFIVKKMIGNIKELENHQIKTNLFLKDINDNYFFEKLFSLSSFTKHLFKQHIDREGILIKKKHYTLANMGLIGNLFILVFFALIFFMIIVSTTNERC